MTHFQITVLIVLPSTAAFLFFAFGLFLSKKFWTAETNTKGVRVFKLDAYTRKLMPIESPISQKFIIKNIKEGHWTSLKDLYRHFDNPEVISKQFRDAINKIAADNITSSFEFESKIIMTTKKVPYKFSIMMSPINDESDYLLRIDWNIIKDERKSNTHTPPVTKEFIIEDPSPVKGFVAFNLTTSIDDADKKLMNVFREATNKDLTYFKNNDVLVVTFFGQKTKQVNKQINSFINKVKGKAFNMGAKTFFNGSGYITLKEVDSSKNMKRVLRALDFFVILSIDLNQNFISNQTESYDPEEFKKYAKASQVFRTSVRTGDFETQYIPIKIKNSRKKVIDYAYPKITGLNEMMIEKLLTNRNNKIDLINAHSKKVGIKSEADKPVLIDVNSDWLIENHKKVAYKKAIYVINIQQSTKYSVLRQVIEEMTEKGYYFAIRVQHFSELVTTLIKQTEPQFILVDQGVWGENGLANTQTYISLLTIKQIADASNIKVIYEQPSELIDEKMAEEIGMKFFYNL